jgi:hypothetical protein
MADRRVGIEHFFLADVDPRDDRLLRVTPTGDGTVGLTIVQRTEDVPVKETELGSLIVDIEPLWNGLRAMLVSEGYRVASGGVSGV